MSTTVSAQNVPTLFLIGDSTCSDYNASVFPRTGWGTTIGEYFDNGGINFDNRAKSGRSSKSFYDEGSWTPVINDIQSGDFLIIQFGHNDEKTSDPVRYTDPYTTYQEYLKKYIDEARAKGAYPILATSIYRNYWNGDGATMKDSHGDYPPAMRTLATEEDVPLVDAHVLSKTLFESLGKTYTTYEVFMNLEVGEFPNYPSGNSDNTHLQENGAYKMSEVIANDLSELSQSYNYLSIFSENALGTETFITANQQIGLESINKQIKISSNTVIEHLIINDLSGRILFQKHNLFNLDINAESWSSGIYCVRFYSTGKLSSKKFIVSN
ncbi:GDSL-type esterase/lipase family protein [Flavisericum labens]|uniref:GDSL-type esterase/lipase family protein n=1 Tax=Flavisericum labens TaxID=3377112 RepID=UPI00387B191A